MLKNLARAFTVATFAIAAAIPTTASAAGSNNGITVVIGHPITLQNRVLATVPVTITCAVPITIGSGGFPGSLTVNLEQANRPTISYGTGSVSLFDCPTTPATYFIQVTPDIQPVPSGPFHKGGAIALATAQICDNNFPQTCESGSVGWQSVRI